MIYLDNASTTPLDKDALAEFEKFSVIDFYNASAIYKQAVDNKTYLEEAKQTIAKALGTTFKDNIVFTGSASQCNNMAIFSSLKSNSKKIIMSMGEHPSVYNVGQELINRGYDVCFAPLQQNGQVDYDWLEKNCDENVCYISIMHVSNETGAINDLRKIYEIKQRKCPNALFHSDGVQAFGKLKINVEYFGVDFYTVSAHKVFGPKGLGALYIKDKKFMKTFIYGGGQEYNLISGTENIAGIMSFKKAVENFGDLSKNFQYVKSLKDLFLKQLDGCYEKNNSYESNSPYVLSLSFSKVNGETLVHMMEQKEILISTGSACSSKKVGNRILQNIGLPSDLIKGSVRISFSKYNTEQEILTAGQTLKNCYFELKERLR